MDEDYKNVLSETSFILKHLEKETYNKIPNYVIEQIEKNKNENYVVNYDFNKKLKNQKFSKETFALISVLFIKYCAEDDERKRLLKICREKEIKEEKLLRQKYDPENIFKDKENEMKTKVSNIKNQEIILKKQNLINKVINFIKKIFNKW